MPQLDPSFFLSQLFWLLITFSFLLFFLWKISLPRISEVLEKRENSINNDIESAKKLQSEAEEIQNEIDQQLKNSRNEADKLINEAILELQDLSNSELTKVDNEISKKINDSENLIKTNKTKSIQEINNQIIDITKITLLKLTSISISESEIKDLVLNYKNKLTN